MNRRLSAWQLIWREERGRSSTSAALALDFAAGCMTDCVVERLDVNRNVERLRLDDIIANLELTDVILSSSGGVTGHVPDRLALALSTPMRSSTAPSHGAAAARRAAVNPLCVHAAARAGMTDALAAGELGPDAGIGSRAAAMVIDVTVIAGTFYGALAIGVLTVQVLSFHRLDPSAVSAAAASVALAAWTALYFSAAWWLFGKTVGKAVVGLRAVRRDGGRVSWTRALARVAGYA